jgi:hypothetical protein
MNRLQFRFKPKTEKNRTGPDFKTPAVGSSSKGKGKSKYPRGVCWNCGKKGHFKDKCPDLVTDAKSAKEPKKEVVPKKSDTVNAMETVPESDEAFSMEHDSDPIESDNSDDVDWFDEVAKLDSKESNWFSEEESINFVSSVSNNDSLESLAHSDTSDLAQVAADPPGARKNRDTYIRAELYDSGCTITDQNGRLIGKVPIPKRQTS